jgi:H+/Cl- antiporter ClcA
MKKQFTGLLAEILRYLRKVTLIVLGITALAAGSFVFTAGFTLQAFSDRMFWAGVVSMVIGGLGVMSMMNLNHNVLGLPNLVIRKEDARKLMDNNLDLRAAIEKRYDFGILFWFIGLVCIAIGALTTVISARVGVR